MTQSTGTLTIDVRPQNDHRLGRQMVHDERSRAFVAPRAPIDRGSWHDKAIRLYDPTPNPNQTIGNCTGCAKSMQLNATGNRVTGRVLRMSDAERIYSVATGLDPWEGTWPPTDTGSSGLASAKAAQQLGLAGEYVWEFEGIDGVVQNIMEGRAMSLGTWWYYGMFDATGGVFNGLPVVRPTGGQAGGHQWVARGYDADRDRILGRCWWGTGPASEVHQDFWIARSDAGDLLADGGDAHWQKSV